MYTRGYMLNIFIFSGQRDGPEMVKKRLCEEREEEIEKETERLIACG